MREQRAYYLFGLLQRLIGVLVIGYAFFLVGRAVLQNKELNGQLQQAEQRVQTQEMANAEQKLRIAYEQTDTYRERELRRRLGYKKPGETVIGLPMNVDSGPATGSAPVLPVPATEAKRPNYRLWLGYYFDER